MEIEVLSTSGKSVAVLSNVNPTMTIAEIKKEIQKNNGMSIHRQSIRLEAKGQSLKDEESVKNLGLRSGSKIYVRDLGPQIGWKTVFLAEYAGPLVVYLWIYQRPWLFYGDAGRTAPIDQVVHMAAICYAIHYVKRLLETIFVHRFSKATMPFFNLFKNCSYYWLFTAYVAYHVNHPKYTAPSVAWIYGGLALFVISELGNLSIHIALRNLRPPGTKVRRIPVPTGNPFTLLFNFVSCPNYTYEFGSWVGFTIMTSCLPAGLFALAGMYQMSIWALGKHKAYKKEFPNYPKSRKAILPFVL
ncbi:putative very-long-chain enoyl-CoA reductase art-1 [Frankliniella fusca]|uniref:very-long-chain enoyl-CoA reductase n=1 Tax=Frankliniella fusca TaxID=407009 RepID=A0AAE1I4Q0_9NEOP|nr:putative very-long-chain enoyl-CoA reductase art-1 [Frankliniella fusca]